MATEDGPDATSDVRHRADLRPRAHGFFRVAGGFGASRRTWAARGFVAIYLLSVTGMVGLLAVIGDGFLAIWLAVIELASVVAIVAVTRGTPSGPSRVTRLGTPNDPGMPSGRR